MTDQNSVTPLTGALAARILDGSPDAILVCDVSGIIRSWNAGAERIFGFPRDEALGASLDLIIPERLRARHWNGWTAAMSRGTSRYGEGELLAVPALHKDGRQISIEFSIQLIREADAVRWVVACIRDVTERYARDKALRAELAALRARMTD